MSNTVQRLSNLISLTVNNIALNPILAAPLLFILTKGPPQFQEHLFKRVAALRDPEKLAKIVKGLKWLLALGLVGSANKQLNKIALNAWRLRGQKKKWDWNKEIAVVTGGCSGIGLLVVKGLVRKNVKVAVLDIQQLPVALQGYANIKFFACDITDATAVNTTAERIRATMGSPTILVNNAGIANAHSILETSDEWLRKIFDVNLLSNFTTVKAFLPDMIANNKGHIVTVASLASFIAVAGMVDYSATKAGVLAFHEGLNQELKNHYKAPGILTSSIHPNWVRTPLIQSWEKELRKTGSALLEPQQVADAVVNQIASCSGGQVFLPSNSAKIGALRGWPNWIQEGIRDGTSASVLPNVAK
ncbi:dehydrogenase/reductase SDR family member 8 precursor [Lindgomyces ingoldianus]|uniref:Dehydrogenase/reductase SDR family member 8 n=1 Tax=Lindgomyces ingoldianus TaxID=673940 RepID=A0ACB6QXP9_9PLEO|nr:dehydrogenase/reductase SDR family member 8 precursor [Lindgomyces ingoldianus]KAF2471295.1 dehydrogenase/reductase SDR family member 8 precursor [Lindgomyces ingoldianus]